MPFGALRASGHLPELHHGVRATQYLNKLDAGDASCSVIGDAPCPMQVIAPAATFIFARFATRLATDFASCLIDPTHHLRIRCKSCSCSFDQVSSSKRKASRRFRQLPSSSWQIVPLRRRASLFGVHTAGYAPASWREGVIERSSAIPRPKVQMQQP